MTAGEERQYRAAMNRLNPLVGIVAVLSVGFTNTACSDKPGPGTPDTKSATATATVAASEMAKAAASPSSPGGSTTPSPPTASSGTAPAESASASAAPEASVAALFQGDVPEGATARPIFKMSVGSGVIVLVPKGMTEGAGTYGEGYGTTTELNGKMTSRIILELDELTGAEPKVPKLTEMQLKQLCYKSGVDKIGWDPSSDVTLGPDGVPAIVWKGKGVSIGKGDWGAYAVSTVVGKNKAIMGCGTWDLDHPELEKGIVLVLKSIRLGKGVQTDPGNP